MMKHRLRRSVKDFANALSKMFQIPFNAYSQLEIVNCGKKPVPEFNSPNMFETLLHFAFSFFIFHFSSSIRLAVLLWHWPGTPGVHSS